jgi:hypothetical protein
MNETRILIRFLGRIFHGLGNSAQLCKNFGIISGGGLNLPNPPLPLGTPVTWGAFVGTNLITDCLRSSGDDVCVAMFHPFLQATKTLRESRGIV